MKNDSLILADGVWHRVVQIIQEAILMGVDCTDLLRQIRVMHGQGNELVLTPEYEAMVLEHHKKLLDNIELSGVKAVKPDGN